MYSLDTSASQSRTAAAVLCITRATPPKDNVRRCARKARVYSAEITIVAGLLGIRSLSAVRRSAGCVESKMYLSRLNIYLSSLSLTLKQFSAHRISVNRLPVPFTML